MVCWIWGLGVLGVWGVAGVGLQVPFSPEARKALQSPENPELLFAAEPNPHKIQVYRQHVTLLRRNMFCFFLVRGGGCS